MPTNEMNELDFYALIRRRYLTQLLPATLPQASMPDFAGG